MRTRICFICCSFVITTFLVLSGCTPPEWYWLSGSAVGLKGQVTLRLHNGERITVSENQDRFTFLTPFEQGNTYAIEVIDSPESQICGLALPEGYFYQSDLDHVELVCYDKCTQSSELYDGDRVCDQYVPEVVEIPGGVYEMGCVNDNGECREDQFPVHQVSIVPFQLGKFEVTYEQFDQFAIDVGLALPSADGEGRGSRAVVFVNVEDVNRYFQWLNDQLPGNFRMPTEAEWEYAARAGTTTIYYFGDTATCEDVYMDGCGEGSTVVGQFAPNAFGLFDMHGNVYEHVSSCPRPDYTNAPIDGAYYASLRGCRRSGSSPQIIFNRYIRASFRSLSSADVNRLRFTGFRAAKDS